MDDLIASSVLAWIVHNKFVNENLKPIEFSKHRFLIDYLADDHPEKVTQKAAQVGLTVAETFDNFHKAKYRKMNVIHTLQTKDVIKGFVFPKVNPIINNNPAIKELVTVDSEGLKQVGDSFIYYRGANAESQAINISADILKIDELDRSNPQVVAMYPSRLDASEYKWKRYFSNPSAVGFGINEHFMKSNQFHWFVKCSHCNYEWFIGWESDGQCHYVDRERNIYACGKCKQAISTDDRTYGRWVAKYPSRETHGYWFSQMMAPWFTAKELVRKYEDSPIDIFYNFNLGLPFTSSDLLVNRETILRACAPSTIPKTGISIGVDQNAREQIWVAATPNGVFAHGKAKSWEEIEHMKLMYNAIVVCDPNPYSTKPKQLAEKYPNFYLCYFKETKTMSVLEWKGKIVYADRTRLLDIVANEITEASLLFRERPYELEDYIADWQNIYRTTVEEPDGRTKSTWLKKENKESDYSFATAYCRIGLSKVIGGNAVILEPKSTPDRKVTDTIRENGQYETTITKAVEETFDQMEDFMN